MPFNTMGSPNITGFRGTQFSTARGSGPRQQPYGSPPWQNPQQTGIPSGNSQQPQQTSPTTISQSPSSQTSGIQPSSTSTATGPAIDQNGQTIGNGAGTDWWQPGQSGGPPPAFGGSTFGGTTFGTQSQATQSQASSGPTQQPFGSPPWQNPSQTGIESTPYFPQNVPGQTPMSSQIPDGAAAIGDSNSTANTNTPNSNTPSITGWAAPSLEDQQHQDWLRQRLGINYPINW